MASTSSEQSSDAVQVTDNSAEESMLPPPVDTAMGEYYRLQQNLLICTVAFSAVIFFCVWLAYSLPIALNYLIGACGGVVYLRMLAKNVANLGRGQAKIGSGRLAIVIGLILVASQWHQLEIVPVFLGFLTYKAALIAYTLWTAVLPNQS
ncbi:MAG: ATP synthase subunit I [Leptolyngbya sp.]|nr:ATP synthase subunit I [Leptolyngbya sp.]